jgi:colanic acid/amylovoran biosynthesis glycosyltransferase
MGEDRPLRLLVVGVRWPPETFLQRLFDHLLCADVELTMAVPDAPAKDWLRREGFHWLRTPRWSGPAPLRFTRLLGAAALAAGNDRARLRLFARHARRAGGAVAMSRAFNRLLPFAGGAWDVIYFPWNDAAVAHAPLYELGIPVVVSCRGAQINIRPHLPQRTELRDRLTGSLARATCVHCVSGAIREEAVALGADPRTAVVIRPAVDPTVFAPAPDRARRQRFTVVTTGSLIWRKGHEYAIAAMRQLVDRGIDAGLDIIGDGPDRQRIVYTIHDLGLQSTVRLLGRLEPNEVLRHLQTADAFLLSSLSEGISNAVLEAMACGLPVVTTDSGGMREAVTDGLEGFVVPVRDPDAMAHALVTLAGDPLLRARMGDRARCRIVAAFTLQQQSEQFVGMLREAAKHGGVAGSSAETGPLRAGSRTTAGRSGTMSSILRAAGRGRTERAAAQ